jgi:flagellar biosynthesis protein FlhB
MTDAPDQESKTEQASEKRIRDAVEKGDVPYSKEATTLGSVAAILAGLALVASTAAASVFELLREGLSRVGTTGIFNRADSGNILGYYASETGFALIPLFALIAGGGILGALGQNVPSGTLERLQPKWNRLSPKSNFPQMFGKHAAIDLAITLAKLTCAAGLAWYVSGHLLANVLVLQVSEPAMLFGTLTSQAVRIASSFALLCLVIAIIDVVFVRFNWSKKLMMTRQEVKDEHKQSEGDPAIKNRIKMLARRRINSRMMANVPKATMVIVNPEHYAVAMRYVPGEDAAPVVIAKGMDHLALRIKQTCEEHRIPVIPNPPLARALHKKVAVGAIIPADFYKAVAEIIRFIEMKKRLPDASNAMR